MVIVVTLVLPGLTLPALIRRLGVGSEEVDAAVRYAAEVRADLARAAMARLDDLADTAIASDLRALPNRQSAVGIPAGARLVFMTVCDCLAQAICVVVLTLTQGLSGNTGTTLRPKVELISPAAPT